MAENVLGTLFQNIADAIRSKTGDTATMKPSEFPDKISGIETNGGGGSTGTGGTFTVADGEFEADNSIMTVEHNLGYVPDILFIVAGSAPAEGNMFFAIGYSKALYSKFDDSIKGFNYGLLSGGGALEWSVRDNMESDQAGKLAQGCIRECSTTSFVVGGTTFKLNTTEQKNRYHWYAISGITG